MRRPADFVWFLACAALMLACSCMAETGWLVVARHAVVPAFLVAAFAASRGLAPVRRLLVDEFRTLPVLVLFLVLVGTGGMVSHGAHFAAMAHDFWHGDLTLAPDRRPVLPALAYLLPPFPLPYAVVWYGVFCLFFLAAWRFLREHGLAPVERFALLTASIAAYLLIVPGYTEVLCFLVALLCWRAELGAAESCVAVAVMIGAHEVAGGFAVLFLAIEADPARRRVWLVNLVLLGSVYVCGTLLAAGHDLGRALAAAARPAAVVALTAPELVLAHPWRCALGIAAAYKLFWALLLWALLLWALLLWALLPGAVRAGGGRAAYHAGCVLLTLPLVLVATDTSRIVQFASLSMFALVAAVWPRLAAGARRTVTIGSIALPSLYVGTNVMPAWGKGLYAIYLLGAESLGLHWGGMMFD